MHKFLSKYTLRIQETGIHIRPAESLQKKRYHIRREKNNV